MKLLSRPHPFIFTPASVLLPGLITFLIISLLAPFGFQNLEIIYRLIFGALFGVSASVSVWIVVVSLKKIYPSYEEDWTVGKEIGLIISVLSTIVFLVFVIFSLFDLTSLEPGELFQKVIINTVIISIIPITILVLFEQYSHQRKQLKEAQSINEQIQRNPLINESIVSLKGENDKTELRINANEILYLKSEGNYVDVFLMDTTLNKKLIRNRLKTLTDMLPSTHFFACHKSYVVNTEHILSLEGNARNFELTLRGTSDRIPVSRSKSTELKERIS